MDAKQAIETMEAAGAKAFQETRNNGGSILWASQAAAMAECETGFALLREDKRREGVAAEIVKQTIKALQAAEEALSAPGAFWEQTASKCEFCDGSGVSKGIITGEDLVCICVQEKNG